MKNKSGYSWPHLLVALLTVVIAQAAVFADRPDWQKEQTDWRAGNGSRNKSNS